MKLTQPSADTAVGSILSGLPAAGTPFRAKMTDPKGNVVFETDVARDAALRIEALLKKEKPKTARSILRKVNQQFHDQGMSDRLFLENAYADLEAQLKESKTAIEARERAVAVLKEFADWTDDSNSVHLQRLTESRAHVLQAAIKAGQVANWGPIGSGDPVAVMIPVGMEGPIGQVFVVEHDWAAAFKGAREYEDHSQEFRLPYENVCFEFLLSGKHVCALTSNAHEPDCGVTVTAFIELKTSIPRGWLRLDPQEKPWREPLQLIGRQIKAICVALEAQVAETEIVRAPHRLNHARERAGKLPVFDHHIVRLSRRSRPAPLAEADAERTPGTRKRLHFRRGHWRHYEAHKTWIKWMLVGNPDLGFIDKQYRL